MTIFPAILTDSLKIAQEQLDLAAESPLEVVQIDIIDGFFADNITVAPLDLATLTFHELHCDLHLMVDEPMDYLFEAEGVRTHLPIRAVIAQIEHMSHQMSFVDEVKKQNWKAGLAIDIFTPLEEIEEECWNQVDIIQLMGNLAGEQGEALHPELWPKLAELQQILSERRSSAEIYIDVGVKEELLPTFAEAEVHGCAMGSEIWRSTDPVQKMTELSAL